jgi:CheY-like chemotaxis protein
MSPIKILLVDDSKSARYALRLHLQRHEAEVETMDSAEMALERIKEEPPDAVFMDHTMPGMNGFEALDILKAGPDTAGIPVVMCTANEDPDYLARALRKGALDVLPKSAAKDRLADLLSRIQDIVSAASIPVEAAAAATRPPVETAMDGTAIIKLIQSETARLVDQRLDSMFEERLHASLKPMLEELSERVTADIQTRAEHKVDANCKAESKRLRDLLTRVHTEQAKLSVNRLTNVLPQAIEQQFERERNNLAQLVQELIDNTLDNVIDQPRFMQRILDLSESRAASAGKQAARIHAKEVSEEIARDQAEAVAHGFVDASKSTASTMYQLSALAALAGIGAAGLVYLLLS